MADLAQWLTGLPLGVMMRRFGWLFPLLQTLHILATGLVMSASIMISLRLWRVSKTQSVAARAPALRARENWAPLLSTGQGTRLLARRPAAGPVAGPPPGCHNVGGRNVRPLAMVKRCLDHGTS